eukprot:1244008-Amphidinium_carterae.3
MDTGSATEALASSPSSSNSCNGSDCIDVNPLSGAAATPKLTTASSSSCGAGRCLQPQMELESGPMPQSLEPLANGATVHIRPAHAGRRPPQLL